MHEKELKKKPSEGGISLLNQISCHNLLVTYIRQTSKNKSVRVLLVAKLMSKKLTTSV